MSRNMRNLIMNTFPFLNILFIDIDTENQTFEIFVSFNYYIALVRFNQVQNMQHSAKMSLQCMHLKYLSVLFVSSSCLATLNAAKSAHKCKALA